MGRLPWRLALRADRRAFFTTLAVALAAGFALVSLVVPATLKTEAVTAGGGLDEQAAIVARPGGERFDAALVEDSRALGVALRDARTLDGDNVTLVALVGETAPSVEAGFARPASAPKGEALSLTDPRVDLVWGERIDLPTLAPAWIVVAMDVVGADGFVDFVVVETPTPDAIEHWEASGFVVARAPAVEPFLVASVDEIADGLLLLVPFSALLVALFAHEFLRSEVRERRAELAVWRALGMTARQVRSLLVARAGVIGAVGVGVGALGGASVSIVIGEGLAGITGTAARFAAAAAALWLACVLGAAWASWRATRTVIVEAAA